MYALLRIVLYPFIYLLQFFNKRVKERFVFEARNREAASQSFFTLKTKAHFCFHVSSEGEFEQIASILDELLKEQYKIEIIFTSKSVEHKILKLQEHYSSQIRILRLALLSANPLDIQTDLRSWVSANIFFMVRYDFFPELLTLGKTRKDFILLNASLKNKKISGIKGLFFKRAFRHFSKIICANEKEKECFENLGIEVQGAFDFRIIQIVKRVSLANQTLLEKNKNFTQFENFLNLVGFENRFIYGSLWDYEVKRIKFHSSALHVIIPHQLDDNSLESIKKGLPGKPVLATLESDFKQLEVDYKKSPFVIILKERGILCELYRYFSKAYVGGGFGVSVHSVLEPYIAGNIVFCGPRNHRSTEIDFIKERAAQRIIVCEESVDLSLGDYSPQDFPREDYQQKYEYYLRAFKGLLV